MKNIMLVAILEENYQHLKEYAKAINNGSNDSTYFYVNGNEVSVSNPFTDLSYDTQKELLEGFLRGKKYSIESIQLKK